jgi:hypothetical protein
MTRPQLPTPPGNLRAWPNNLSTQFSISGFSAVLFFYPCWYLSFDLLGVTLLSLVFLNLSLTFSFSLDDLLPAPRSRQTASTGLDMDYSNNRGHTPQDDGVLRRLAIQDVLNESNAQQESDTFKQSHPQPSNAPLTSLYDSRWPSRGLPPLPRHNLESMAPPYIQPRGFHYWQESDQLYQQPSHYPPTYVQPRSLAPGQNNMNQFSPEGYMTHLNLSPPLFEHCMCLLLQLRLHKYT